MYLVVTTLQLLIPTVDAPKLSVEKIPLFLCQKWWLLAALKAAGFWADPFFQIFNLTDGGSLVQKKDSRKVTELTPKRRLWTFLTSWMQLKPSNPRQRTISAKRVSSKTLQTPSIPKNRPAIGRSEFFGIKEGDTFHPLQKRILLDSRLNLNIENQFLEIPSSTLMGVQ